jgi:probable F420-dependent oxidoreductase
MLLGLRVPTNVRGEKTVPAEVIFSFAKKAEEYDFHSLWVMDHLLDNKPITDYSYLDPLKVMTAMSSVTKKVRVGSSLLIAPLRNPVLLAKEIATMDWLSGGRIEFGIAAGWLKTEFDALQIPFESRGKRADEILEVVTRLWTQDEVSYDGEFFKFNNVSIDPKPVRKPHPPVTIGGGSVPNPRPNMKVSMQSVFRRIAKYADRWHATSLANLELVGKDFEQISKYAIEFGRKPEDIEIWQTAYMFVAKTEGEAKVAYKEFTGKELDETATKSGYLVGTKDSIVAKIAEREKFGVKGMVLSPLTYDIGQVDIWHDEILSRFT